MRLLPLTLIFLILTNCAPEPEPAIDEATVTSNNTSLRLKNSSTSRTIVVLESGAKVEVLERQDNWYRVRYTRDIQGWMEESTLRTNETDKRIQQIAAESQNLEPQNTASLRQDANLRLEPGRTTSIIRRVGGGTRVEVLERVTKPRPGSETARDMWIKVRPAPGEVGWVLAGSLEFDIPGELSQYSEGFIYAAVKRINRVQDSLAGDINWYVIAERKPGSDPDVDFQGIRVFTWNLKRHRYETAFRTKGMRGVYPLEVRMDGPNPAFRIYELAADGETKIPREFVMYGVIVREKKDS
jgi:uncharacterized protein YgiM (DUF1202 family)